MKPPKLTKLQLQIMEVLWAKGPCAMREIQEAFPKRNRPAYSTIQTTVYRLETKGTLRRIKKISHAHIFEASISRGQAQGRLIDELLALFGGRLQPVMVHLVETRKLTLEDVREAEKALLALRERDEKEAPECPRQSSITCTARQQTMDDLVHALADSRAAHYRTIPGCPRSTTSR